MTIRSFLLVLALGLSGCAGGGQAQNLASVSDITGRELPRLEDFSERATYEPYEASVEGGTLDIDSAVRLGIANNRELRAVLREIGVTEGEIRQAGLLPNPTVEVELLPERNTEVELRVELDLTHSILAGFRSRALEPELRAVRFEASGHIVEFGYRVRAEFLALQSALRRIDLGHEALDALLAAREMAEAMRDAGHTPDLDVVRQRTAYERARLFVAELELDAQVARERLVRVLGLQGRDLAFVVPRTLPPLPDTPRVTDALETRVLERSLRLAAFRERMESLARRLGLARIEGFLPEIAVDLHALEGNPEVGDRGNFRFGGGVSASVPLFSRNQGLEMSLAARFDALRERYLGEAVDSRSLAREFAFRVASAHARARHFETEILPAQRELAALSLLQYNAMQVSAFELLTVQLERLRQEIAAVRATTEYWTSEAALEALLAGQRVGTSEDPGRSFAVVGEAGGH